MLLYIVGIHKIERCNNTFHAKNNIVLITDVIKYYPLTRNPFNWTTYFGTDQNDCFQQPLLQEITVNPLRSLTILGSSFQVRRVIAWMEVPTKGRRPKWDRALSNGTKKECPGGNTIRAPELGGSTGARVRIPDTWR